jgi:hypothetical protein
MGHHGIWFEEAAIEDFNLDGRADIVWVNSINGSMQIWFVDSARVTDWATVLAEAISPSATHRHGVSLESGTSMERRTLRVGRTEHRLPVF